MPKKRNETKRNETKLNLNALDPSAAHLSHPSLAPIAISLAQRLASRSVDTYKSARYMSQHSQSVTFALRQPLTLPALEGGATPLEVR